MDQEAEPGGRHDFWRREGDLISSAPSRRSGGRDSFQRCGFESPEKRLCCLLREGGDDPGPAKLKSKVAERKRETTATLPPNWAPIRCGGVDGSCDSPPLCLSATLDLEAEERLFVPFDVGKMASPCSSNHPQIVDECHNGGLCVDLGASIAAGSGLSAGEGAQSLERFL